MSLPSMLGDFEFPESYVIFLVFGVPGGIMFYRSFGMASKVQKFSDDMEKTMIENEKKRKINATVISNRTNENKILVKKVYSKIQFVQLIIIL